MTNALFHSSAKSDLMKVLLIDRSIEPVQLDQHGFSDTGADRLKLTHAADLLTGMSFLNRRTFDIILLSLDLNDRSLTTIVSEIQQQAPYTPIVCIVDGEDDAIRNTLFGIGVQDFLQKQNLDRAHLLASLKNAIGRHRLREEIDKVKELERYLAFHDVLTGLPSRRLFYDRLERGMIDADRCEGIMAVLFLDIDNFGAINKEYGHGMGDKVLQAVARRIEKSLRANDTVARTERDEFAILLSSLKREQDAGRIAGKLLGILSQPLKIAGNTFHLSACIGISLYPGDGRDPEALLRNADVAMYQVRGEGPASIQYHGLAKNAESFTRLQQIDYLRNAIDNDELRLLYQPVFNLNRNQVTALEVQLRWQHPSAGWLSPDKFMMLAEDFGLVDAITNWVIETACQDFKKLPIPAVNGVCLRLPISAVQYRECDFVGKLIAASQRLHLKMNGLGVEIDEAVIMQNTDQAMLLLEPLMTSGAQITIGGYGAGQSSIRTLRELPINSLKVDRSLVKDIPDDKDDMAIVSAVVSMAHHLNLSVICEGVENFAQVAVLRFAGCDEVQGYFMSRPLPFEALEGVIQCNSLEDVHQVSMMAAEI